MHYFKLLLLLLIILFSCNCYAENWQDASIENKTIYIDTDSVYLQDYSSMGAPEGTVYYDVKYYDNKSNEYIWARIESYTDSTSTGAKIIATCKFSDYIKDKNLIKKRNTKYGDYKGIHTSSLLYNANEIAKEVLYDKQHKLPKTETTKAKNIDFSSYMNTIQKRIKEKWYPPKETQSQSTIVSFRIDKTAYIISCKIVKSSGNQEFDEAAIKAIKSLSYNGGGYLKPFPKSFQGNYVDIQYTFDYNVHK